MKIAKSETMNYKNISKNIFVMVDFAKLFLMTLRKKFNKTQTKEKFGKIFIENIIAMYYKIIHNEPKKI